MSARRWLVVVSPDSTDAPALARLQALLPELVGAVDALILRWKGPDIGHLVSAARGLREAAPALPLLLRDRFDAALAAGLAGVQLPEDGVEAALVRAQWPGALIGVSRHDSAGLGERAAAADFALVSPVFASASKPALPGLGLGRLRALVRASGVPVLGLGGVDARNAAAVIGAGAAGVAVRSAVFGASDPPGEVRALRAALDSA